jgi:hypothetical protein
MYDLAAVIEHAMYTVLSRCDGLFTRLGLCMGSPAYRHNGVRSKEGIQSSKFLGQGEA